MAQSRGGVREWSLESRWRYALVWGGLNFLVVFGLIAMFGSLSVPGILPVAIAAVIIAGLVHAYIWYPIAKRKVARENSSMAQ